MSERAASSKSADAYRTISEVADDLGLPQHVLRFWETRFPQVKPLKRAGGRRFYRPADVELLRAVQALLYGDGYTIRGVQRMLRDQGPKAIAALSATTATAVRHGSERESPSADEEPGLVGDDAASPSWADDTAVSADEPDLRGDRFQAVAGSLDTADRLPRALDADLVVRLQAVLSDLAECERIICRVENPSFSS